MSKYRDILNGDVVAKSAHGALRRKVDKLAVLVGELHGAKLRAEEAAAERAPGALYVTREDLLYALETGEAPAAWTPDTEAEAQ